MNKHYDSYMATIHQPAIPPRMGDLTVFFGNTHVSVQPTLSAMIYPDYVALAKEFGRGIMFRGLIKKK
jgi:hypothetical protein